VVSTIRPFDGETASAGSFRPVPAGAFLSLSSVLASDGVFKAFVFADEGDVAAAALGDLTVEPRGDAAVLAAARPTFGATAAARDSPALTERAFPAFDTAGALEVAFAVVTDVACRLDAPALREAAETIAAADFARLLPALAAALARGAAVFEADAVWTDLAARDADASLDAADLPEAGFLLALGAVWEERAFALIEEAAREVAFGSACFAVDFTAEDFPVEDFTVEELFADFFTAWVAALALLTGFFDILRHSSLVPGWSRNGGRRADTHPPFEGAIQTAADVSTLMTASSQP
jgi:hypothetical protein